MGFRSMTVEAFAESLAARTPAPGGGAVAAVTAAHAAALGAMVLEFTAGKPRFAAHEAANADDLARLTGIRLRALALADRDAAAYGALNALWRLPKDAPERALAWDGAVAEAIDAPQAILDAASEVARICESLSGRTSPTLESDRAIAVDLARVAARAAAHNVEVNLPSVADEAARARRRAAMEASLRDAGAAGARGT